MSIRDPSWRRVRTLLSYGVAVTSVLVALLLTRVLASYFESFRTPLFFSAIMLSTWFGGFIPGMVATLLSVPALKYYYVAPLYSWSFDIRHVPLFVIFSISALFISWVIAKQQHAERAVRRVRDELEVTVRERTATLRRTNEELQAEIAERTRAEEALRASEERWRAIFENSAVGIALVDANGRPMAANPALQRMLGYTADELLTLSLTNLTHEDELVLSRASMAELVEGRRQQYDMQKRYRRKDGRVIWVNASGSVVPGSDRMPRFLVEIIEDITDRKLAEDSLRKAQAELAHVTRLTTMGELAASIAHEVNQPLAAVITNGNASLRWLAAPTPNLHEAREAVQRIIRDGHRAGDVIQRVRALLKKTGPQKAWLDINDVIHEVLTLAHSEVRRHRVALRTELAAGLPPVLGDRIQLQQVILNLVMNGMEAMSAVADRSRELLIRSGTHGPQGIFTAHGDEEARGRCAPVRWPFWTNPSAMRSCSGRFRPRCRLHAEVRKAPIAATSGHMASQVAIGVKHTMDDYHHGEIFAMLAEAKLFSEDGFRRAHHGEEIIGESPALKEVLRQVEVVAPTDATILLQGETGTGKERLAHAVHQLSARRDHPFVTVNCAAIPSGLLESELFGHERGAFAGAIAQKIGRFELAHQGTLFLDEIGDLPVELQPKLLRVLQEQEFERLGSTRTRRVDVRLVAATNRDLAQTVDAGHFRADLYYRLNVFPLTVPPLRQRPEDIPLLVRHFVRHYARHLHKRIDMIPAEALDALTHYYWPGNVRELQNVVERAVILSPGPVLRLALDELPRSRPTEGSPAQVHILEEVEREHILRVVRETNGVIGGPQGAATRLDLRRTTLLYRMEKLGISRQPQ